MTTSLQAADKGGYGALVSLFKQAIVPNHEGGPQSLGQKEVPFIEGNLLSIKTL